MQASIAQVFEAMFGLEKRGFVSGPIKHGTFTLSVTLKGACWLLVSQPLLKLSERAKQLITHPEASESTALLINAYSEAPSHAAHKMYVVIEKLENAAGGERKLIELLGQPKAYIGDLKQSLQLHRHAETQARIKLNYRQCLERTTKIIEVYIALYERPSS